ncbi:YiiX/YebB-like N1pC/P60 family cysteine hydrolase [Carboxylicivirga sp. RSCT41]|uniref:YiiX/YebB-like N1pC/P60 family cysteine hydrolase n=1 Tax=Carboxylicivirga agarovorans TaxID=3417570 RepID=UPI003D34F2DB
MNRIVRSVVIVLLILGMGCTDSDNHRRFQTGDILFRGRLNGSLSRAIDAVTQTGMEHHYTHMGIVELINDTVWVYHAAPVKGVCKELLADFCLANEDSVVVGHFRIKNGSKLMFDTALDRARQELGQPYNYSYILDDEGFYCSEYIYHLFEQDSVFKLNPMTFVDPSSGEFHSGWIRHYKDLGIEIPEGEPGCNPNGMAASENLEFLGRVME